MNPVNELLDEIFEMGVHIIIDDDDLRCRSAEPLSPELISRLRLHKDDLLQILRQQRRKGQPHLAENGELRVSGMLPPGTMLDILLELGASDQEIERHVTRIQMPTAWQRWQIIKPTRTVN